MTKAFDCATRLLCRREHSAMELANKLTQRGYSKVEIVEVIAECQRLGLQSDVRFVESYCSSRIRQGYGPLRIKEELRAKQIDRDLINSTLKQEQDNWIDYAQALWLKKYGKQTAVPSSELLKRQRFMLYRGFPTEIITKIFNDEIVRHE